MNLVLTQGLFFSFTARPNSSTGSYLITVSTNFHVFGHEHVFNRGTNIQSDSSFRGLYLPVTPEVRLINPSLTVALAHTLVALGVEGHLGGPAPPARPAHSGWNGITQGAGFAFSGHAVPDSLFLSEFSSFSSTGPSHLRRTGYHNSLNNDDASPVFPNQMN